MIYSPSFGAKGVSRNINHLQLQHLKNQLIYQSNLLCGFGGGSRPNFHPILTWHQESA